MADAKAYIRVSGDKEDRERQRSLILKLVKDRGLGKIDFIEESFSGQKSWRERALGKAIERLGTEDMLVVAEMSHLGASLPEISSFQGSALERCERFEALPQHQRQDHNFNWN